MSGTQRPRTDPSGLTRWTPRLVVALGVVHLAYGVAFAWPVVGAIVSEGVVATVKGAERGYVLWFLAMLVLGAVGDWAARTVGRLPAAWGWGLVAIGLFVAVPDPVSGGWLLVVLGVLALVATRHSRGRSTGD